VLSRLAAISLALSMGTCAGHTVSIEREAMCGDSGGLVPSVDRNRCSQAGAAGTVRRNFGLAIDVGPKRRALLSPVVRIFFRAFEILFLCVSVFCGQGFTLWTVSLLNIKSL